MDGGRDLHRIGNFTVDIAAHGLGEARVLNAEHHLQVEVETPKIEIRRADVHGVIADIEFGVEFGRLIFEDLHAALQQAAIGEARCGNGGIVVGFGSGDQARFAAALDHRADPPQHRVRK
jgi:hypothetical protein